MSGNFAHAGQSICPRCSPLQGCAANCQEGQFDVPHPPVPPLPHIATDCRALPHQGNLPCRLLPCIAWLRSFTLHVSNCRPLHGIAGQCLKAVTIAIGNVRDDVKPASTITSMSDSIPVAPCTGFLMQKPLGNTHRCRRRPRLSRRSRL